MPTTYSYSRLGSFRQCPRKYSFHYIEHVKVEKAGQGIEAFMGSCVHEALEKLYKLAMTSRILTLAELKKMYKKIWSDGKKDLAKKEQVLLIVNQELTEKNYYDTGVRCLSDYYAHYSPFDQSRTLGLESQISIDLNQDGRYLLTGFIDRLTGDGDGVYSIRDYKTNNRLPDADGLQGMSRQLGLYQIAVQQKFPEAKEIRLIWHMLRFDQELQVVKDQNSLEILKQEVIADIHAVEAAVEKDDFPCQTSNLCDWCEYKSICPAWKHPEAVEKLEPNEYLQDDGVKLVNKYAELSAQKSENNREAREKNEIVDIELAKLQEAVIAFADKNGITVIQGGSHRMEILPVTEVTIPTRSSDLKKYEQVVEIVKQLNAWQEYSTLDAGALKKALAIGNDSRLRMAFEGLIEINKGHKLSLKRVETDA